MTCSLSCRSCTDLTGTRECRTVTLDRIHEQLSFNRSKKSSKSRMTNVCGGGVSPVSAVTFKQREMLKVLHCVFPHEGTGVQQGCQYDDEQRTGIGQVIRKLSFTQAM